MIQLGKTLISEDIIEKEFVCNISKCKGICCIEGDAGAPLSPDELPVLDRVYPEVKAYLRPEGIAAIEEQGTSTIDEDGEDVTPLIDGGECAYVVFETDGTASCAIEKAYRDGKIDWKKPISCHLYPIRVQEYSEFSAVNYHKWDVCGDACTLGRELKVPVYQFLKEPLIRKFGEDWYQELCDLVKDTDH